MSFPLFTTVASSGSISRFMRQWFGLNSLVVCVGVTAAHSYIAVREQGQRFVETVHKITATSAPQTPSDATQEQEIKTIVICKKGKTEVWLGKKQVYFFELN